MRIEQLKYFMEVARCGSIRKASEHLYMAQQSLSQSVKKLESEMGVELFERSLSGVTLTREGEAVREFAEAVLRAQDKMDMRLADIAQEREEEKLEGDLNVYAFGVYNVLVLPELLKKYRKHYPKVKISNYTADFDVISSVFVDQIAADSVGLVVLPDGEQETLSTYFGLEGIQFLPCFKGKYLLCCSIGHPLAKKHKVSLEQAACYSIVDYAMSALKNKNGVLYKMFCRYDCPLPKTCIETQLFDVWMDMVASGQGVGFLHEYLYNHLLEKDYEGIDRIIGIPLTEEFYGVLGCVVSDSSTQAVKRFAELLVQNK